MKVLVTGGLGFIGSHTTVELIEKGFTVHIIDDLSNSKIQVLGRLRELTGVQIKYDQVDLKNIKQTVDFFDRNNDFDCVIHFAASKAVGESVQNPIMYYENNISALLNLLKCMNLKAIRNIIFSSSCTVYGQAKTMPITEETEIQPAMSPYGNTKKVGEEIIRDAVRSSELNAIILRYFNPIGAHPSAKIGELPIGVPQNLIPYITQTAAGKRKVLSVFGSDYPTEDGTAIRDYINVVDLANAHVVSMTRLLKRENENKEEVYNLGTGKGNSVLEVIRAFEASTGVKLPYEISERREGDIVEAYADTSKANTILNWKAEISLEDSLLSAWNWEKQLDVN